LDGLVHLPLVTPPVVVGWLLLGLFGPAAPMGRWLETVFGLELMFRWTGAALAAGVMALPLMVRAMRLSFDGVDRRLEAAARSLGAGPFRVFWTVSAPLAAPGVLAALVLGFARALGEFGATIAFVSNIPGETRTLSLAIYNALQTPGGEDSAARLAGMSIRLSLAALVATEAMIRKWRRNEA
jgi:molybdate transport system permease protein